MWPPVQSSYVVPWREVAVPDRESGNMWAGWPGHAAVTPRQSISDFETIPVASPLGHQQSVSDVVGIISYYIYFIRITEKLKDQA